MNKIRRPRIGVERLEQRDCPAFTISLSGSNLLIYGLPTAGSTLATTGGVQINEKAANTFQVLNAGVNEGTYVASNVTLTLINHNKTSVNVNLNKNTLTGNLAINLGNGSNDPTGSRTTGTAIFNGTVAGNVTVSGGGGTEVVELGQNTSDTSLAGVSILGNVNANGKAAPGSVGNLLDTGYNFTAGTKVAPPTVFIGGNLTTSAYNGMAISKNATVGGNITAVGNGVPFNNNANTFAILVVGKVGGSVTAIGSPGSTGDVVVLADGTSAATVGSNFTANLSNGTNTVIVGGTVGGNTQITAGNGANTIDTGLAAFTTNNMTVNLGNGTNTFFDFSTAANGISANSTITNNLSVTTGNGVTAFGTVASTEFGNLSANLGNGNNQSLTLTGPVQGVFNYRAGNGNDAVTVNGSAAAPSYIINVLYGSGSNTFTFGTAATPVTISGTLGAFPSSGTNVFVQGANGTISAPWYFYGF